MNDARVSGHYTRHDVKEAAFGGAEPSAYDNSDISKTAYMLFYRRVAEAANIIEVPDPNPNPNPNPNPPIMA